MANKKKISLSCIIKNVNRIDIKYETLNTFTNINCIMFYSLQVPTIENFSGINTS